MKKPLTAVLGCGPTGLLAAYALQQRGVPFSIFSQKKKSVLGGAQYSHIPILGIHDHEPEATITYQVEGDPETYRDKVYGATEVPFVSMENVKEGQKVAAWNLRELYDNLWERFETHITDVKLGWVDVHKFSEAFDLVISSVHLPLICAATVDPTVQHWFKQQTVRIYNESLIEDLPNNVIVYDGTKDHSWYRMSKIFGTGSTEWGASSPMPPLPGIRTVNKPLETNCDCHPLILKIGRFGAWQKGVLTYHGYNSVIDSLEKGWDIK